MCINGLTNWEFVQQEGIPWECAFQPLTIHQKDIRLQCSGLTLLVITLLMGELSVRVSSFIFICVWEGLASWIATAWSVDGCHNIFFSFTFNILQLNRNSTKEQARDFFLNVLLISKHTTNIADQTLVIQLTYLQRNATLFSSKTETTSLANCIWL